MAGAATPALAALTKAGVPHEVVKFDHDPREHAFGVEAVKALTGAGGIAPEQIYKTLVIAVPPGLAVAIVQASARLSLKAAAAALGVAKAAMAEPAVVQRATGYLVGAVSPVRSAQAAADGHRFQCARLRAGVLQRRSPRLGCCGGPAGLDPRDRCGHRGYSGIAGVRRTH